MSSGIIAAVPHDRYRDVVRWLSEELRPRTANCEGSDSDERIAEMQDWFDGLTPETLREAIRYEGERRGQK